MLHDTVLSIIFSMIPLLANAATPDTFTPVPQQNVPAYICDAFNAPQLSAKEQASFNSQGGFIDFQPGDRIFSRHKYHEAFIAYYAMFFCDSSGFYGKGLEPEVTDNDSGYLLQQGLRLAVDHQYDSSKRQLQRMTPGKNSDGLALFFLGTVEWAEGNHDKGTSYWVRAAATTGYLQQEEIRVPVYVHAARYMLTHLSKVKPPTWSYGNAYSNSDPF